MARLIRLLILLSLLVVTIGVYITISNPKSVMAAPFRGLTVKTLEVSAEAVSFFQNTRRVAATHERSIVSNALQTMIISEEIDKVPPVAVPTNDMASFPSPAHPLFPNYLQRRYGEFKYMVDNDGKVTLDKNEVSYDPVLAGILQTISEIKQAQQGFVGVR